MPVKDFWCVECHRHLWGEHGAPKEWVLCEHCSNRASVVFAVDRSWSTPKRSGS